MDLYDALQEASWAEEFRLDEPTPEEKAKNRRNFQAMMLGRLMLGRPKMPPAAAPMDLPAAIATLNERRHRGYTSWRQAELYRGLVSTRTEPIAMVEDPGSLFPQSWWLTEFEAVAVATLYKEGA